MKSSNTLYVTKTFMSGRSQAVRIPKEFHIEEEEVYVNQICDSIVITLKGKLVPRR